MGVTTVSPILTADISLPLQALQLVDHPGPLSHYLPRPKKQMDSRSNDYLERFELPIWSWWVPCDQASNERRLNPAVKFSSTPNSPLLSSLISNLMFNAIRCYPTSGFHARIVAD